jgi:hypothetical protein
MKIVRHMAYPFSRTAGGVVLQVDLQSENLMMIKIILTADALLTSRKWPEPWPRQLEAVE